MRSKMSITTVMMPLLIVFSFLASSSAIVVTTGDVNDLLLSQFGKVTKGVSKLKHYLQNYGYLNSSYDDFSDFFDPSFEQAIETYQQNFNLNPTGKLDLKTLQTISLPRCGNPDIVNGITTMKSGNINGKNFTFEMVADFSFFPGRPRWPRNKFSLTYAILPANRINQAWKQVFANSFARWAAVSQFRFREILDYNSADIKIAFHIGDHGDGNAFDGRGGVLAHAFAPTSGLFHLDTNETWTVGSPIRTDLESVSVHEIGHLLGLGHSSVRNAIMYPTLTFGTRKVFPQDDDIAGLRTLYA